MAVLARPYPTTVGIVRGGSWASNVMERLTADARAGVALGETVVAAEERFRTTLLAAVAGDPWLRAHPPSVTRTGAAFGASSIPDHHPLVEAVRAAAGAVTGTRPAAVGVPYGCDMALWTSAGGAACLVYGPGDIRHAHAADERVSLTETVTVAAALEEAVRRVTA
jgi:acetylornithine deacetylase